MTFTVPTTEPSELTAGETWRWNVSLPQFPNADYALAYTVKGASAVTVTAALSATDPYGYELTVAASATATIVAGLYQWAALVTETATGAKYVVRRGVINVRENFGTATPAATHNEKMYAAICAALEGRTTADVESYSINGRALNRIPYETLEKAKNKYAFAVWAERHPGQAMPSQKVAFNTANVEAFPFGVIPGTLAQ